MSKRIRVAIIGTGNIGADLCERLLLDDAFSVVAFVGRRSDSPGLKRMAGRVEHIIDSGIEGFIPLLDKIDGAFDATSAFDHAAHWEVLKKAGKWAIDLTPSRIGKPIVPELTRYLSYMEISNDYASNYSMVTCGGQSSAPLVYAIAAHAVKPTEIEISSSIASLSAGPATRRNLDQYISSTENLATLVSGGIPAKAILVLNPADPPIMMRTTATVKAESFDLPSIQNLCKEIVNRVSQYVPGYDLVVEPHELDSTLVSATVKVTGEGFYLPEYAGNLDIINAAAVETAKRHMMSFSETVA
jgi:acetaldehyde dehydrogenase (acetylating)